MIVTTAPTGSRLVTQSDHARLAADLLRLFRVPELLEHPRRELLLRAVAEHDNGWWEADAAPRLDAERASALDFRHVAADLRQEIWRRGVERFATENPYLAALLATHALRLSRPGRRSPRGRTFGPAALNDAWSCWRGRRESPVTREVDDRWLALADGLSLAVCAGEPGWIDLAPWRLESAAPWHRRGSCRRAAIEVALEPFPFAGATVFELSCRWLGPGPFPPPPLSRWRSPAPRGGDSACVFVPF